MTPGRTPNQSSIAGDRYDRAGVEDRSRLPRDNLDERGTRRRLEVAARIDEIDDGDLDRVAPLTIETGGRGDELLDLVDLSGDRVGRRFAAERGGERGAID